MAFMVNHYDSQNHLFTVTLHEGQGSGNRVVHVIVPNKAVGRLTPDQLKKQAKAAAKKALQDAVAAL